MNARSAPMIEVFADVACPFTHVGLQRFQAYRQQRELTEPVLYVRAWSLELVNGAALDGRSLIPKVEALRAAVAPDLFAGFDADRFPVTTLPALAAEALAYGQGLQIGERFSFEIRHALFEEGLDVSDPDVLRSFCRAHGIREPDEVDRLVVGADFAEGTQRGVVGSPHFFTPHGDFFCPTLAIEHRDGGYEVSFDAVGFQRFMAAVFG